MGIQRVRSDMRDGVKLVALLEEFTGVDFGGTFEKNPANLWHCMQNATAALVFIHEQTGEKVAGCKGNDVMQANLGPMLNLLKSIRQHFDREYLFKSQNRM